MNTNNANVTLNAEQQDALKTMLEGHNIFLTGEAGTGKSTVIREFLRQTDKNAVVVAPTGIAALNVNGVTIHSFFQFPCTILKAGELEGIRSPKRKELIKNTDVVIIDEISMVRSDLFMAIDTRLRYLGDSNKPFGGKQIIVIGDFFQLPPFAVSEPENVYLQTVYGGIYCFKTAAWQKSDFEIHFLKTVHRQNNDPLFARVLAKIRANDMTADIYLPNCDEPMTALEALNTVAASRRPDYDTLALCTSKENASAINMTRASQIDAPVHRFTANITGDFKRALYPTVEVLDLKVGERVMTLANKYEDDLVYCNGDVGTIQSIDNDTVTILFDKGISAQVKPFVWSNFEYQLVKEANGKIRILQKEVGRFSQLPLKLAYASTIHKSQGLSLERSHVVLGNGCFAAGQCYTALSRVRTLDGLTLDRAIKETDLFFAPEVIEFYNKILGEDKTGEVINLEIPKAYADKVKEFLAGLMEKEVA